MCSDAGDYSDPQRDTDVDYQKRETRKRAFHVKPENVKHDFAILHRNRKHEPWATIGNTGLHTHALLTRAVEEQTRDCWFCGIHCNVEEVLS